MTPTESLLEQAIANLREWDGSSDLESKIPIKAFTVPQLERLVIEGYGDKKFRAKQLFEWMFRHLATSFDEMSNLSKDFRATLNKTATMQTLERVTDLGAPDGTKKFAFKCDDGAVVESVFLPFETHNCLCISSQVGCAMGCTFCYTAKMGLVRHLRADEIVEQVVQIRRWAHEHNTTLNNIVFMGMGEPLHNLDVVMDAANILTDGDGLDLSRRKVTVSTSGLVDAMNRFMAESDVQLAVSLNATTDVMRSEIMPVNDRYDLDALMGALRELPLEKRQRVTLEYVLLKDFNDSLEDAARIVELVEGIPCKINLIPFNPHPETPFETPSEEAIDAFKQYLLDHNVSCFRRKTRGRDEMAACGQLGQAGVGRTPRHLQKRLEALEKKFANS